MLEFYYVKPETWDRFRASWIYGPIERYVEWLNKNSYSATTVRKRVPILVEFGEFARQQGVTTLEELPGHIEGFAQYWLQKHGQGCKTDEARNKVLTEAQIPARQMLVLFMPELKEKSKVEPFQELAPGLFDYMRNERGIKESTLRHYRSNLYAFERYLQKIGLKELRNLSPVILSGFVTGSSGLCKDSLGIRCTAVRILVRYLYREQIIANDLSGALDSPRNYRLSSIPRSITWDEVNRMLEAVDRRTPVGKRDHAILLLLVTYGLRAREIAAMTLDDIDWRQGRIRVPERKAGHSTAYPLSTIVGEAILDYLRHGRPKTSDRHIFFRTRPPYTPMTYENVSGRAACYLRKAGIPVSRPGSHTLRHTCVQRLVDTGFSLKTIGDYVGHRSSDSTAIYAKVALDTLREIGAGVGEDIL